MTKIWKKTIQVLNCSNKIFVEKGVEIGSDIVHELLIQLWINENES